MVRRKPSMGSILDELAKKASELAILCGAKIDVIDCFLAGDRPRADDPARAAAVRELIRQQAELTARLEAAKQRRHRLEEAQMPPWLGKPLDTLGLEELVEYQKALAGLKAAAARRIDQIVREARPRVALPGPSAAVRPAFGGGSSGQITRP